MSTESGVSAIKVRLVITSETLLPTTISDALGIEPSMTWLLGETVHPRAINRHTENGWVLIVEGKSDELSTDTIVDRLMELIPQGRLTGLSEQFPGLIMVELSVVASVSSSGPAPAISLTPTQVAYLASCGGSVDVDLYSAA